MRHGRPRDEAYDTRQERHTLGDDLARAISIARSGRPGPVHVALPADVLMAQTNVPVSPPKVPSPARPRRHSPAMSTSCSMPFPMHSAPSS